MKFEKTTVVCSSARLYYVQFYDSFAKNCCNTAKKKPWCFRAPGIKVYLNNICCVPTLLFGCFPIARQNHTIFYRHSVAIALDIISAARCSSVRKSYQGYVKNTYVCTRNDASLLFHGVLFLTAVFEKGPRGSQDYHFIFS